VQHGQAMLYSLQAFSSIKIKDISGKVITESTLLQNQNSMPVPVAALTGGLYFIEVYANSALITTKKLVVE
jgi:Secretion system C-terminal sorting domain